MATPRYGSAVLARIASPSGTLLSPAGRTFSTSLARRERHRAGHPSADAPPKVRHNPLIGNYVAPKPTQLDAAETPPVSTDRPRSSKPPQSSAEVPPNADMPPPPPPPKTNPALDALLARSKTGPGSSSSFPYDAAKASPAAALLGGAASSNAARGLGHHEIDIAGIIGTASNKYANSLKSIDPQKQNSVRPAPVLGRTVFVKSFSGQYAAPTPAAALGTLNRIVRNEQVRNKFHTQKFHERKGLRRKRLASERWRGRFKAGFKETVQRVLELKRQGW